MGENNTEITNYMETLVYEAVDNMIEQMELCKCEHCRMDMVALALNSLTPKYVVTENGKLYTKITLLQQQYEVDILSALTKAAMIVKKNPRHDSQD